MKKLRRRIALAAVLVLGGGISGAALILASSSGAATTDDSGASSHSSSKASGTLRFRFQGDISNLDPHKLVSTNDGIMRAALYDFLIFVDAKGKVVPWAATRWTVTTTSVQFSLRKDITCADGSRITPAIVAASLRRYINPATGANVAANFGSPPYKIAFNAKKWTVTFRVGAPNSDLLNGFANVAIICRSGLTASANLSATPAGSGAFTLASQRRGVSYTLRAHKGYDWGPLGTNTGAKDFPETIVLSVVPNETTAANLLLSGALDVGGVSGPDAQRLRANESFTHVLAPDFGMYTAVFNQAPGRVTTDPQVRRAIAQAISRRDWNTTSNNGVGLLGTSIFPRNLQCFDVGTAKLVPKYDPNAARALLASAGWTPGAGGKLHKQGARLDVRVLGGTFQTNGPDYIVSQLNSLGINATLSKPEIGGYIAEVTKGNFDVNLLPLQNSNPTPSSLWAYYTGPFEATNWASLKNTAADEAARKAKATTGPARCRLWAQVQRAIMRRVDAMPLANPLQNWFLKDARFATPPLGNQIKLWTLRRD